MDNYLRMLLIITDTLHIQLAPTYEFCMMWAKPKCARVMAGPLARVGFSHTLSAYQIHGNPNIPTAIFR